MTYILQSNVSFRELPEKGENIKKPSYEVAIILCIHQGVDMVKYYVANFTKYCKNFVCVIHYNSEQFIDENLLPPNFWICRRRINTERYTRRLFMGFLEGINLALQHFEFTNFLILTSGSVIFRNLPDMSQPIVAHESFEDVFSPNSKLTHLQPIPISLNPITPSITNLTNNSIPNSNQSNQCVEYLKQHDSGPWVYTNVDMDQIFQTKINIRNFKWIRGSQVSGNVFPREVGQWLFEDWYDQFDGIDYQIEEIYFPTYAYNWAVMNHIKPERSYTMISWDAKNYKLKAMPNLQRALSMKIKGYAVCKVSEDLNNPVRLFLNK